MNERIHKVLDGELSRGDLTPAEQTLLAEYEGTLAATARALPRYQAPDLTSAVMARIAALETSAVASAPAAQARNPLARAFDWLWTPRPMVFRPAWGLAAATVAALAFFVTVPGAEQVEAPIAVAAPTEAAAPAAEIYVHFRLDAASGRFREVLWLR